MIQQPKPRRIWCGKCLEKTVHRSLGTNSVTVPVWECTRDGCDHSTSGFYAGADVVDVATDGGERK